MLRKRSREDVPAVVVADKIEKIFLARVERGADRGFAGAGDRPRRQAGITVRVVRRIEFQVALLDGTDGASMQSRRIDDRGVALQRNSFFQTPGEHTRNHRPLARRWSLLLHQRGERDDGVQLCGLRADIRRKLRIDHVAKARQHRRDHIGGGHAAREAVGVRKKITLQRHRLRSQIMDRRTLLGRAEKIFRIDIELLAQDAHHVEAVGAFGYNNRAQVNIADHQFPVDIEWPQRAVEQILAGLEAAARPPDQVAKQEGPSGREDAALDEHAGRLRGARAGFEHDNQVAVVSAIGTIQLARRPTERNQDDDAEYDHESLDHGWSAWEARSRSRSLAWKSR